MLTKPFLVALNGCRESSNSLVRVLGMPGLEESVEPLVALTTNAGGDPSPLILAIDIAVEAQLHLEQRLRAEFGTNNTDFRALLLVFRLRRRGQVVRPGDVVRGLGVSSGAASQIIARLVGAGLLERARDPSDARAGHLSLTPRAARQLSDSTEQLRADLDHIVAGIAEDEQARIIALLEQVTEVFQRHRRAIP